MKKSNTKKRWLSPHPKKCDICEGAISKYFIDGRTFMGPWAFMCRNCHTSNGCGLGVGNGQLYKLDEDDGVYYLIKGGGNLG